MLGCMLFLLSNDPRAVILRRTFVFKFIPILNPDGVHNGHYRVNSRAQNLNRFYAKFSNAFLHEAAFAVSRLAISLYATPGECPACKPAGESSSMIYQPSVSGLSHGTESLGKTFNGAPLLCSGSSLFDKLRNPGCSCSEDIRARRRLFFYLDHHAHANKRGCFLFGNSLQTSDATSNNKSANNYLQSITRSSAAHAWNLSYARMCSVNSPHMEFESADFRRINMWGDGSSSSRGKGGAGRVALWRSTGVVHCYTLECNYTTGKTLNHIPSNLPHCPVFPFEKAINPAVEPPEFAGVSPTDLPAHLSSWRLSMSSSPSKPPIYTPGTWLQVGESCVVSLCDLYSWNPLSRLPGSKYLSLQGVLCALPPAVRVPRPAPLGVHWGDGSQSSHRHVLCSAASIHDAFRIGCSHLYCLRGDTN